MTSRSAGDAGWGWEIAAGVVQAIQKACDARLLVRDALTRSGRYEPAGIRMETVAIGKAARGMMEAALAMEPWRRGGEFVCVPDEPNAMDTEHGWKHHRGDHPLPGANSVAAALAMIQQIEWWQEESHMAGVQGFRLLLSGGASALVCMPAGDLRVEDVAEVTRALQHAGAGIADLNTVRKHIDEFKGGRLAELIAPFPVDCLILSDVLGDDPSVVGSGPVSADPTTFADALEVLERFGVRDSAPAVTAHLEAGERGEHPETPKPEDPLFDNVRTRIIGNNDTAADAAAAWAEARGLDVKSVQRRVQGEAREVGGRLAREAAALPVGGAIVLGGETTVKVISGGHGGRNQELALAAAIELDRLGVAGDVAVVTFGTDGVDGVAPEGSPPAAGAVVTGATVREARARGLDAAAYLERNDSYAFFAAAGSAGVRCHIVTGPTGTNVCDVAVGWRKR